PKHADCPLIRRLANLSWLDLLILGTTPEVLPGQSRATSSGSAPRSPPRQSRLSDLRADVVARNPCSQVRLRCLPPRTLHFPDGELRGVWIARRRDRSCLDLLTNVSRLAIGATMGGRHLRAKSVPKAVVYDFEAQPNTLCPRGKWCAGG